MSAMDCINEIRKAAGKELSDDDLDEITSRVQQIIRDARNREVDDLSAEVTRAVDAFAVDVKAAAAIEKRNAVLNKLAELRTTDYILSTWGDRPHEGLIAVLGGVTSARQGTRYSVGGSQAALAQYYHGALLSRLEKEGVLKLFNKGTYDREVWLAMHEIGEANPKFDRFPEDAVKIARVLHDINEAARIDANLAGAWIKKLPGYVIRQTHDMARVRKAGEKEWKEFIADKLDWDKTLIKSKDRDKALSGLYSDFSSGVHIRFSDGGVAGFKGFANIGKKMSHDRVLHFKSPEDSFEYNRRFGVGNLNEGMIYGLEHMAQNTAMMRHLGPNAEATIDNVIRTVQEQLKLRNADTKLRAKFDRKAQSVKRTLWPNLTGASRIPGNEMFAQVSMGVRSVQQMGKLGLATASAIADIPFFGSELRYQGQGILSGIGQAMGSLVRGRDSAARREIIGMLGVLHDGMKAAGVARFDVSDNMPGRMAKTTQLFFKLNGLRWWTDRLRTSAALSMSHRLAMKSGDDWEAIGPDLQRVLGLFGMDSGKWDIARAGAQAADDGRHYLTPEGLDDVADDLFVKYLSEKGQTTTPRAIAKLRSEIKDQMRSYFHDRSTFAVLEPDARTRGILLQGTQPGTPDGELFRHLALFKSFMATVIQKPIARELYGKNSGSLAEVGLSEMYGLARLILWNTVFGYGAMTAKDAAKGREPRDPTEWKTVFQAMLQGGSLGIYGDFLLGDMKNRFGGTPLETLAGPTASSFNDVVDLAQRLRDNDDTAAQTFRFILNHAPFINLFYSRIVLDYLIFYDMQEWLSPGSLRRMERRIEKDTGQKFIFPPSEAA